MEITDSVSCDKYRTNPSFTARSSALSALVATGVAGVAALAGVAGVAAALGVAGAGAVELAGLVSVGPVPAGAVAAAELAVSSCFLHAPNVNITAGMTNQNNRVFIEAQKLATTPPASKHNGHIYEKTANETCVAALWVHRFLEAD